MTSRRDKGYSGWCPPQSTSTFADSGCGSGGGWRGSGSRALSPAFAVALPCAFPSLQSRRGNPYTRPRACTFLVQRTCTEIWVQAPLSQPPFGYHLPWCVRRRIPFLSCRCPSGRRSKHLCLCSFSLLCCFPGRSAVGALGPLPLGASLVGLSSVARVGLALGPLCRLAL